MRRLVPGVDPTPPSTGTPTPTPPSAPFGPGDTGGATSAQTGSPPLPPTDETMGGSFYIERPTRSGPPLVVGGRPTTQGVVYTPKPISDEVRRFQANLYSANPSSQTQMIVQGLVAAGRVRATASPMQIVAAYQQLLTQSGESYDPKTKSALSPDQILAVDIEFNLANRSNAPRTTREKYFTRYTDQQAARLARDNFRASFGRNPTAQEERQYVRALRRAAASAPREMVYNPDGTRYMTDGFNFDQWNRGFLAAKMSEGEDLGGEYGIAQDRIQAALTEYGLDVSEDFRWNMLRRIGEGTATVDTAVEQIRDLAKTRYRGIAEQIDRGLTVQQVADPYIRSLNRLLERADGSVTNPLVKQALNFTDEKGNPRLMSDDEFEELLRSQPEWRKTVNAREEALSLTNSVLQQMGFGA